jgi:hypothetical protein
MTADDNLITWRHQQRRSVIQRHKRLVYEVTAAAHVVSTDFGRRTTSDVKSSQAEK